ncbi:AT-rich interactive domain-containing protein 5A isoform X2 [Syngnathoides biaculeatus]|uniref:AT-rich interactive domain-containing protein 5A isoform X2 n=2 Tax=Syngnathoides biaculeatus TaxID=300417 RepID=UPI002ADDD581|nr:AT-rich interactive domain-containing protein 5A isoform X2 [Syngnathoides biaculeatus]XP_061673589.1 AT-rich interactive domain-containing protein 5A isoform X2 [Syngnathoides biaculeatus]
MAHEEESVTVAGEEEMETPPEVKRTVGLPSGLFSTLTVDTSPPGTDAPDQREEGSGASLLHMEEKSFVSSLHSFMKERGSPIERIPHLGFKQIDLWMIYKAVEKLGGYNSVTARRLWKKVYDQLGGSPGSTSAATCTRRHYERLVLPYERHLKGEDDKPLPLGKPRKPYKRNVGGKTNKSEWKGKRSMSEREKDSERLLSEAAGQSQAAPRAGSGLWSGTAERHRPQAPLAPDLYVYSHLLHGPPTAAAPWPANIGQVISPLEKKKRVAQASLRANPQAEERDRPSVIRRSVSPVSGSRKCDSSDGSPRPRSCSSFSSRSPSPGSVSSEEGINAAADPDSFVRSDGAPEKQMSEEPLGVRKDRDQVQFLRDKDQIKNHDWKPKVASIDLTRPSECEPTSSSGFIKVLRKSAQLPRPAPIRPGRGIPHNALAHPSKPLKNIPSPWETFGAMPAKFPPSQQRLARMAPPHDIWARDSHARTTSQQPAFLPRMPIPQTQLTYRHLPVIYPYPYTIPLWGPHTSYSIPTVNTFYTQHKL